MTLKNAPDFSHLVAWFEGTLSPEEIQSLERDLATNKEAQAIFAWLQTFFQTREENQIARPPVEVRALLSRRFSAYAENKRLPSLFQRFLGSLTFDSKMRPATASFRTAGLDVAPRQFVFSTPTLDLTLNIQEQEDETVSVAGQIFSEQASTPAPYIVQLLQGSREIALTETNLLGEFEIPALQPGLYELILSNAEAEFVFSPVEISL